MAKLTSKGRSELSDAAFALPGRRFPIPDKSHARNALARASEGVNNHTLSAAQAAEVRRKANAKLAR